MLGIGSFLFIFKFKNPQLFAARKKKSKSIHFGNGFEKLGKTKINAMKLQSVKTKRQLPVVLLRNDQLERTSKPRKTITATNFILPRKTKSTNFIIGSVKNTRRSVKIMTRKESAPKNVLRSVSKRNKKIKESASLSPLLEKRTNAKRFLVEDKS